MCKVLYHSIQLNPPGQPDTISRVVEKSQNTIRRVAGHLIQEKKVKISNGLKDGIPYEGRDLLTLLR